MQVNNESTSPAVTESQPARPRRWQAMRIAIAAVVVLGVTVAAAAAFVSSGMYDVAATTPHYDVTYKVLRTLVVQSIKRHAVDVKVPADLGNPEKIHSGFKNFNAMCVGCHVAPGAPPSEISKGLYPLPPNLADAVKGWKPEELYVIIKNGIKMSGMPAWEQSHSGDEIWALVALLNVLPNMAPEEYREAAEYVEQQEGGSGH